MQTPLRSFIAVLAFTVFGAMIPFSQARAADAPTVGSMAPGFTLPNQNGTPVSLKNYRGKWVVLYFYPKAFTSGCTIEAHNFAADLPKYHKMNADVVGVSVDPVKTIKKFHDQGHLGFTLLSDKDHKVSSLYGSTTNLLITTLAARHTFLIGPKGVIRKEYLDVTPSKHSAQVLRDLKGLQEQSAQSDKSAKSKK